MKQKPPHSLFRNRITALIQNIAVALAYLATAKLGFLLALDQTNATAVWPPAGIALAACLAFGLHVWPGVFIGAFLANVLALSNGFSLIAPAFATATGTSAGNIHGRPERRVSRPPRYFRQTPL